MELTPKERILLAINNQIPDRVPVMPDFSNMIPCRLTGRPFWDIYLHRKPTISQAYADAVDYFGIDGWFMGHVNMKKASKPEVTSSASPIINDRIHQTVVYRTAKGDLREIITYLSDDPPTKTEKMVKDIQKQFPMIRELYAPIIGYDATHMEEHRRRVGDKGIFCLTVNYPGVQYWVNFFDDNAAGVTYALYDEPEIMDEWAYLADREFTAMAEIQLSLKPDVLLFGGSGTLTLASPELVRKYALPTIKKITRMAKEAGVPTMLHSCGKTMAFLDMLVNETDLNCINPLEEPPMGDVILAEAKTLYGSKICLMGNLNTSTIMLQGSTDDVEIAAKKAIDDAGAGGGFILSTGDQCGRDTPDANIFKMVEVAKTYGVYR